MSASKVTAKHLAGVIVSDLFHFRRNLVVSNVAWGLLPWEADLLVMSSRGYVSEIEIKTSIADLKRDPKKRKFLATGMILRAEALLKFRWYAMPPEVWAHPAAQECIPAGAGVIVVDGRWARVELNAVENRNAQPLSAEQKFQLARLGCMRHWSKLSRESRKAAA